MINRFPQRIVPSVVFLGCLLTLDVDAASNAESKGGNPADQWRKEKRVIDLHQHVNYSQKHLERAVRIMDAAGVGVGVNLSGGYTLAEPGKQSAFEKRKKMADDLFPGRFVHYMNLDYSRWDELDFAEHAVRQVEEGHRLGAGGLKEYKRLGLYLRDKDKKLLGIDDSRLDPMWRKCGELGLPVSIHVADPKAFWLPYDKNNERWTELKDHKSWWFGDPKKFPKHEELLAALNRVIERHPKTTFVCVHFANNPEDLDWVDHSLDKFPNMMADLAARVPEIGRRDPGRVRKLFIKHQDRILFATDFMVYDRLILGSGGSGPGPTDDDALNFYEKHWRWMETSDRQFSHMTPIQGEWKIDAIDLPAGVLRKIYFDNARKLLVRTLPPPSVVARHIKSDFVPDGRLDETSWASANAARIDYGIRDGVARPQLSTEVRVLWSDKFLYLGYRAPFETLTTFAPVQAKERFGLWRKDVVEAFIGTDAKELRSYTEYEVAPTGEKLDVILGPSKKDFPWSSGFEAAVHVDEAKRIWTTEMRIPMSVLSSERPVAGKTVWRLNLYRFNTATKDFLGWSPTANGSAHTPARFGYLKFQAD